MVLFNEVEIVLEVLGVAAAGNFLAKKLLFAKDRDQTVDQIRCASPWRKVCKIACPCVTVLSGTRE